MTKGGILLYASFCILFLHQLWELALGKAQEKWWHSKRTRKTELTEGRCLMRRGDVGTVSSYNRTVRYTLETSLCVAGRVSVMSHVG